MLSILTGDIEQCAKDKKPIHTVCREICIHYVLSGKGFYEGQSLQKGQGFIVYKGDSSSYRPDPNDPWKYFWLRLCGDDTERILEQCNFPQSSGVFVFSYTEELEAIFSTVFFGNSAEFDIRSSDNHFYSEAACKLILSLQRESNDQNGLSISEHWVKLAKEYIHANYHKDIKVEEIAKKLHIDRKYLRNLFIRYTQMSTREYIISLRMETAKDLLINSEASISLIASSVGYNDSLNFSKMFKKHTGVSPKKYREKFCLKVSY